MVVSEKVNETNGGEFKREVTEVFDNVVNVEHNFLPCEGEYCSKCTHRLARVTGKGCPVDYIECAVREPIYELGCAAPVSFTQEAECTIRYICSYTPLYER